MIIYDQFNHKIDLVFKNHNDIPNGEHVLTIPNIDGNYLLTQHKKRGIEFPGGKKEPGESSEQAVKRELYEETGATVKKLEYIAQYTVYQTTGEKWFTKDVFFVDVMDINEKSDYLETNGPVLCDDLNAISDDEKSYLLQDEAILLCVERVKALGLYQ